MIHEVMVLDHSGPPFGLILYGAALKLFVLGAVLVRMVAPVDTGSAWARRAVLPGGDTAPGRGRRRRGIDRWRGCGCASPDPARGRLRACPRFGFLLLVR